MPMQLIISPANIRQSRVHRRVRLRPSAIVDACQLPLIAGRRYGACTSFPVYGRFSLVTLRMTSAVISSLAKWRLPITLWHVSDDCCCDPAAVFQRQIRGRRLFYKLNCRIRLSAKSNEGKHSFRTPTDPRGGYNLAQHRRLGLSNHV